MEAAGPEDALIRDDGFMTELDKLSGLSVDRSQDFFDYLYRNRVDGVPVAPNARDLKVNKIGDVRQALQLQTVPFVWSKYLSPDKEDQEALKEYEKIQQEQARGELCIFSEEKHFCPNNNKLFVLLVCGRLSYQLNPRYEHLKGSSDA